MFKHKNLLIAFVMLFVLAVSMPAWASDESERAMKAANVLTEVMQIPENGIPEELMERAVAVAVGRKTLKHLIFELAEAHFAELEKKRRLSKGKA